MNRTSTFWTGGRPAGRVAILMLGLALVIVPEAFAWGRVYGGGFGGGGFNGGGYGGGGFNEGGAEGSPGGGASRVYTYPSRGQSPQQQQIDHGQCYAWAVEQSGFDPANPQV